MIATLVPDYLLIVDSSVVFKLFFFVLGIWVYLDLAVHIQEQQHRVPLILFFRTKILTTVELGDEFRAH